MSKSTTYHIAAIRVALTQPDPVKVYDELIEWCAQNNAEYSAGNYPYLITTARSIKITSEEDKVAFILKYGQHNFRQEND